MSILRSVKKNLISQTRMGWVKNGTRKKKEVLKIIPAYFFFSLQPHNEKIYVNLMIDRQGNFFEVKR